MTRALILEKCSKHCNTLQHKWQDTASMFDLLLSQHTATHCNTLQHTATHCNTLQHAAGDGQRVRPHYCNDFAHWIARRLGHSGVLQSGVLQRVVACCSVLHSWTVIVFDLTIVVGSWTLECSNQVCCSVLQHLAVCRCNHCCWITNVGVLISHTTTYCNTLQHTATHCNTLLHTASHCITLHHTATHCNTLLHTASHCYTLHHTATHCNALQHTTTQAPDPGVCEGAGGRGFSVLRSFR